MDRPTEVVRDSTVYVVDDAADYRFLVQKVFTRFLPQYKVTLFSGGDALLQHLRMSPGRPSLILLDLHMPGMSGLQTLAQLRQDRLVNGTDQKIDSPTGSIPAEQPRLLGPIPVVMVTSSSSVQEIRACYEAGANSCLAKPVGFGPLRHRLTMVCTYWVDTNRPFLA